MLDLLKKSVYATIGFAVLSKERAEELGEKIAKDAAMSETEGRKFIAEMIKKSGETRTAIEKMVHEKIDAVMRKMDLPSRKEMAALEERIQRLEGTNNRG